MVKSSKNSGSGMNIEVHPTNFMADRLNHRTVAGGDNTEPARKKTVLIAGAADADDPHFRKIPLHQGLDTIARDRIHHLEDFIQNEPLRPLQNNPRKGQTLLLIRIKNPVPAVGTAKLAL